jgi:antitoxin component YwqK of YwqJK toxin-antitoxin module
MIKFYLVLIVGFIFNNLHAQDSTNFFLDSELKITPNIQDASFSGAMVKQQGQWAASVYYGNQNLAFTGVYNDKKLQTKNGFFTFYYAGTGRIMTSSNFEYNVPNGVCQSWYENGKQKDSGRKFYGRYIGQWSFWHDNGQLISRAKYADSLSIPPSIKYYAKTERPKIIEEYLENNYVIDYKIGLWQTYFNNGKIKDSVFWETGYRTGIVKSWYSNGTLQMVGAFINDQPENTWNWYYENSKPSTVETYKKGKVIAMQCYDSTGNFTSDYCSLSKPAMFPGGAYKFESYIKANIKYPEEARKYKHSATVNLVFTIDKFGKLKEVQFDATPSIYFNKEVERVLYAMPIWEPAIEHNIAVDYKVSLSVPFIYVP